MLGQAMRKELMDDFEVVAVIVNPVMQSVISISALNLSAACSAHYVFGW
mgnify:CR=1 FL=1